MRDLKLKQESNLHKKSTETIALANRAMELVHKFNSVSTGVQRQEILKELIPNIGSNVTIKPTFRCDYGLFIDIGDNVFVNYAYIILDTSTVKIGNNVLIGPRVSIFSASHPIDPLLREEHYM